MSELLLTQNVPTAEQLEGLTLADVVNGTSVDLAGNVIAADQTFLAMDGIEEIGEMTIKELLKLPQEMARSAYERLTTLPVFVSFFLLLGAGGTTILVSHYNLSKKLEKTEEELKKTKEELKKAEKKLKKLQEAPTETD